MHALSLPLGLPNENYWRSTPQSGKKAIRNFTPHLFTICMGTGGLGVLMHLTEQRIPAMYVISTVFFVLDILFFFTILSLFLLRCVLYPKSTSRLFSHDVEQTTYLSTTSIAASTLTELCTLILGSTWSNWQYACFAFYWVCVGLAFLNAVAVYWILINEEKVNLSNLTPTLCYPTTGLVACAMTGSVIVEYAKDLGGRYTMPVWVVSYVLLGAGFFLTLLTLTTYFTRLLSHQLPPPSHFPAQLIPIAALSDAAYTYTSLGWVAYNGVGLGGESGGVGVLEQWGKGELVSAGVGKGLYAAGFVTGFTIWGFATFWLLLSLTAVVKDVRRTTFNLNMWSAVYPLATYGIASSRFAHDFNSRAFRVITTITLIVLAVYWLYCAAFTLPMIVSGELFLIEVEKEQMEDEREGEGESESNDGEGSGEGNAKGKGKKGNRASQRFKNQDNEMQRTRTGETTDSQTVAAERTDSRESV